MEVAVVGMGFCGMMTAMHLMQKSEQPVTIHIIGTSLRAGNGPAYNTTSQKHLLNVRAGNMGCTDSQKTGFVEWISEKTPYNGIDKKLISDMFLPRAEYALYLQHCWSEAVKQKPGHITLQLHEATAVSTSEKDNKVTLRLSDGKSIVADKLILATGNETPGNPRIKNTSFFNSPKYISNPWQPDIQPSGENDSILIVGNGLTMADVVLGIHENKFNGTIYSLSPHGFTILPHRHNGVAYNGLINELKEPYDVNALFTLFRKHIEFIRSFGLSAEPVVDSVRSVSAKIWTGLTLEEKKRFMRHLRHLWGLARHRLPAQIHDFLFDLRIKQKLRVIKGQLIDITENNNEAAATFYNKISRTTESITVHRVINCTGPLTDISRIANPLLKQMYTDGMIQPDELKLGILTNIHGAIIDKNKKTSASVFTLGGNLRGLLWESTAVPELRVQAEKLAEHLLRN